MICVKMEWVNISIHQPLWCRFCFWKHQNIQIYIFYHLSTLKVPIIVKILWGRKYITLSTTWLPMTWRRKQPGHRKPWYWPSQTRIYLGFSTKKVNLVARLIIFLSMTFNRILQQQVLGAVELLTLNPLRAKFFRGNINIYLHFLSFLHINMTQVVEILPQISQEPTYST